MINFCRMLRCRMMQMQAFASVADCDRTVTASDEFFPSYMAHPFVLRGKRNQKRAFSARLLSLCDENFPTKISESDFFPDPVQTFQQIPCLRYGRLQCSWQMDTAASRVLYTLYFILYTFNFSLLTFHFNITGSRYRTNVRPDVYRYHTAADPHADG